MAPAGTSQDTSDFLNTCKLDQTNSLIHTPQDIVNKYKAHISAWKIRKESTCTHYHHIGHYKAVLQKTDLRLLFLSKIRHHRKVGFSFKDPASQK